MAAATASEINVRERQACQFRGLKATLRFDI
jgi:hypothetical protein